MEKEKLEHIFFGTSIEDKTLSLPNTYVPDENFSITLGLEEPGMIPSSSSATKLKFPSLKSLEHGDSRAKALHFFANHELQAINMMCAILLATPDKTSAQIKFKRGVYKALIDEQKHFKLYIRRMKEFGLDYGSYGQSDFFWRQMENIKTPEQFSAAMALTLESANLDFSYFYRSIFNEFEDYESAKVLDIVLEDEIDHVRIGYKWLSGRYPEKEMWELYQEFLPFPLTPSRSKGTYFNSEARLAAGMSAAFIENVKNHKDEFKVVNRRSWKKEALIK